MHCAVIKRDLKGGFNIYNWHDDTDDMEDLTGSELIGYVSKDGVIDAPYETDELAFDGVIQALSELGFHEKANSIRMKSVSTNHPKDNQVSEIPVCKEVSNKDVVTQIREEILERMQDIAGYTDDDIFLGEWRAYKGVLEFIQKIEKETNCNN